MSDLRHSEVLLFDFGDTLIHGNFTAGSQEKVWDIVYQQVINPTNDLAVAPLSVVRQAWQTHVQSAMARTWREKTEEEVDFVPLVQKALKEAGLAQAQDFDFLHTLVSLEHSLHYKFSVEVAPHAPIVLSQLKGRGYRLGLVSNFCNLPDVAYANIRQLGLLDFFEHTMLSCEVGWRKPSRHIYQLIVDKFEVAPQKCLFIGDRLIEDVQGPNFTACVLFSRASSARKKPAPILSPMPTLPGWKNCWIFFSDIFFLELKQSYKNKKATLRRRSNF